jgi:hypothetical protein
MKVTSAIACLACALLLAGCELLPYFEPKEPIEPKEPAQSEPTQSAPVGDPQPASEVDSLVQYSQHIRKLSAGDLGREYDSVRQAYNRERNASNRVRLAMVLTVPNTSFYDESRAIDLLEPVVREANGRLQPLALMLISYLQEQKRLNANVQGLQQKLDALKSLERSLIERSR